VKKPNEYALIGGKLINGHEAEVISDSMVIIKGNKISYAGERNDDYLNGISRIIDISECSIIPGLIDCHVHLTGLKSHEPIDWITEPNYIQAIRTVSEAQKILEFGITTIRSAGSRYDIYLRNAINEGSVIGPRIIASGLGINRSRGHGDIRRDIYDIPDSYVQTNHPWAQTCDGTEEIRKAVRKLIGQNVDLIKVWASGGGFWEKESCDDVHFSKEELKVLVEEAHMCKLPVMCHCENIEAVKYAVELNVDTIEHGDNETGDELDDAICIEMAKKNIFLTPTLSIYFVGPWAVETIDKNIVNGWKKAKGHGVKLLFGSDAYADPTTPFGIYNIAELKHLVEILGLTPLEAITTGTKYASQALRIEDSVGQLEKGKLADVNVIKGDVSKNISLLLEKNNFKYIIKGGEIVIDHTQSDVD